MSYDAAGNYIDDSADTFGDIAISGDDGENWWNSWSGGLADSEEITLSDGSTVSVSDIYADPSRAKDIIKTAADANIFVTSVKKLFGEGAGNALKNAMFNKDGTTFNPAGIATGIAGLYGLMGGNKVQTGGYNKPIPKLTATREQIPYAADPNRRPGEAGRSYFTDTQYTAPADAAATQAAAKTQAQGIAALATPRAKAVNPYEGKYKPAWNPAADTTKADTTTAASGVAQLLPVPEAQGFQRPPPERTAQAQGNATSAAATTELPSGFFNDMRSNPKTAAEDARLIAENNKINPSEIMDYVEPGGVDPRLSRPSTSPTWHKAMTFMPSQAEIDALTGRLSAKQAANSGIASLPSSDFAYSTNPQEAAAQKAMQNMQREQSSKTASNPSDVGGAGYVENPAYLTADPNRMTMDYIPKYVQENVATTSDMDRLQAMTNKKQALHQANTEAPQTNPYDYRPAGPAHLLLPEPINTEIFEPPATSAPFGNRPGAVAEAPQVMPKQTFATGGLAAGGFVVPADVVAHLGNGSSSSGLALLAEKLNAKPIKGEGDGMSDSIPTHIDGKEKALVANDEAYISPEMVARIGGGNGKVGSEKLYAMMDKIRKARTGTTEQGKKINPEKFMPGGIAQLVGGGEIQRFETGAEVKPGPLATPAATPLGTSTSSSLSPWAGDYVTNYLGKGQALAEAPYQSYGGPLTAGASDLQNQAFAGIGSLAQEGYKPQTYQGGTFGADQAQQYMNPYLSAALNPQLDEMRRQAGITRAADAGRMTQAGAFGGSRQAIMESEGNRNLLDKQTQAIGTGYQSAYDKAMQQFNTEQDRRLGAEKSTEASRQYSADYGLKSLGEAASLGAVQRGIDTEGINADRQQFEEQRDNPYKMVQYQKDLLQGLPITSAATTANTTGISNLSSQILGLQGLYNQLAGLGQTTAAK